MKCHDKTWHFVIKIKKTFFVAKTHNYDKFVAKIYAYVLIESFSGSPGLIDSPTSNATLIHMFRMNEDTSNYSHPNDKNGSKNSSNSRSDNPAPVVSAALDLRDQLDNRDKNGVL